MLYPHPHTSSFFYNLHFTKPIYNFYNHPFKSIFSQNAGAQFHQNCASAIFIVSSLSESAKEKASGPTTLSWGRTAIQFSSSERIFFLYSRKAPLRAKSMERGRSGSMRSSAAIVPGLPDRM